MKPKWWEERNRKANRAARKGFRGEPIVIAERQYTGAGQTGANHHGQLHASLSLHYTEFTGSPDDIMSMSGRHVRITSTGVSP